MDYKILIIEDEPLIADDLLFHLADDGYKDVQIALSYPKAIENLSIEKFDLILLDINLSGDKDGTHLARFINANCPTPFIYVTSYYDNDTLNKAKATQPAAYIVKPFDKIDIQVNVSMVLAKRSTDQNTSDKFFVKDNTGLHSIHPNDISFVEAFDNYAKVFSRDKSYIVSHTLKSIEDKLTPFGFERVHKSYLVNFNKITRISEDYLFFDDLKVPIGRAFKKEFMKKIATL